MMVNLEGVPGPSNPDESRFTDSAEIRRINS